MRPIRVGHVVAGKHASCRKPGSKPLAIATAGVSAWRSPRGSWKGRPAARCKQPYPRPNPAGRDRAPADAAPPPRSPSLDLQRGDVGRRSGHHSRASRVRTETIIHEVGAHRAPRAPCGSRDPMRRAQICAMTVSTPCPSEAELVTTSTVAGRVHVHPNGIEWTEPALFQKAGNADADGLSCRTAAGNFAHQPLPAHSSRTLSSRRP